MNNNIVCIGQISRVHGYDGAVMVRLEHPLKKQPKFIFIDIDKYIIPFYILDFVKIDYKRVIMKYEYITDRRDASMIVRRRAFVERAPSKDSNIYPDDCRDYEVVDEKLGRVGVVVDFKKYKNQEYLVVQKYQSKVIFLVPDVPQIVKGFDNISYIVYTDMPAGLVP
jgi:ribosomal 30S subunit maturation factor RimM